MSGYLASVVRAAGRGQGHQIRNAEHAVPTLAVASGAVAAGSSFLTTLYPALGLTVLGSLVVAGVFLILPKIQVYNLSVRVLVFLAASFNPALGRSATGNALHLTAPLAVFVAILALVTRRMDHERDRLVWKGLAIATTGYVGLFLISSLDVLVYGDHGYLVALFRMLILLSFIAAMAPAWRSLQSLLTLAWWTMVGNCAVQIVIYRASGGGIQNRIFPSGQAGSNAFAVMLIVLLLLRLALSDGYAKKRNVADLLLGSPVILIAMALTYSRGAFVALAGGLVIYIIQSLWRRTVVALLAVAGGILGVYLILNSASLGGRFSQISIADASGRSAIFAQALSGFERRPILGNGLGTFDNGLTTGTTSAHNVYLQILFELGIVGLTYAAVVVLRLTNIGLSAKTFPAAAGLCISSFTDNHYLATQFGWIVGLVFVVGVATKYDDHGGISGASGERVRRTWEDPLAQSNLVSPIQSSW